MANTDKNSNIDDDVTSPRIQLNSVLQYAISNITDSDSQQAAATMATRTDDEKLWLSNALDSMSTDHVKVIRKNVERIQKELENPNPASSSEIIIALDELQDWLDNPDFALDFCKMDGLKFLKQLIQDDKDICSAALETLALICENDLTCQSMVNDDGEILGLLLVKVVAGNPEEVRVKAVRAISSLVRSNERSNSKFVETGGYSLLMGILKETGITDKLRHKCAFLLFATSTDWSETLMESLVAKGLVIILIETSLLEHRGYHEFIMGALLNIVRRSAAGRKVCREQVEFNKLLSDRIAALRNDSAHDEEVEYMKQISSLLKGEDSG